MKDSMKQFLKIAAGSFVGGAALLIVRDIYYDIKDLHDTGDFDRMVKNIKNTKVHMFDDPWDDMDDGFDDEEDDFLFPPDSIDDPKPESEDRVFDWDALRKKVPTGSDSTTPVGPSPFIIDRVDRAQQTSESMRENMTELMDVVREIRAGMITLVERAAKKDSAKETKKKNKKAAEDLMRKTADEIINKASEPAETDEKSEEHKAEAESPKKTEKKSSKK